MPSALFWNFSHAVRTLHHLHVTQKNTSTSIIILCPCERVYFWNSVKNFSVIYSRKKPEDAVNPRGHPSLAKKKFRNSPSLFLIPDPGNGRRMRVSAEYAPTNLFAVRVNWVAIDWENGVCNASYSGQRRISINAAKNGIDVVISSLDSPVKS